MKRKRELKGTLNKHITKFLIFIQFRSGARSDNEIVKNQNERSRNGN